MEKLIEHIKHQLSCFKSEKSKAVSQNDKLCLGGRIAALEELLADISTDDRPLTPEILTAAGWDDLVNTSTYKVYEKTIFDPSVQMSCWIKVTLHPRCEKITIEFTDKNAVGKIFTKPITVNEFNMLLDIVKLSKFKIK